MGVENTTDAWEDEASRHMVLGGKRNPECFFCGEAIQGTFVYWSGCRSEDSNDLLHLHLECAQQLGQFLIRDGMNAGDLIKKVTGKRPKRLEPE